MGFKRKAAVRKYTRSKRMRMVVHNVRPLATRRPLRRRTTGFSTRTLNPVSVQKKGGRKLSKRAYRNLLWRSTVPMTKYKSARSFLTTQATPVGVTTKSIRFHNAMSPTATEEFYRVGGGLQDINFGITPNLGVDLSSVIIRGGMLFIQLVPNPDAADNVIVTVELRRMRQQISNAADTAVSNTGTDYRTAVEATNRPLTWTLDDSPDSQEYFTRAYLRKTMVLPPGQMMRVEHRLRVEKWDTAEFERGSRAWVWLVMLSQVNDVAAAAETVQIVRGHDLSFTASADAI